MNYENLKWINQSLYTFNDKEYDSHGFLDISISISTEDDINFSQPKLVFNLDNQGQRRNIRLTRSNVIDLVESIDKIRANIQAIFKDPQSGDITKRYNNNKDLVVELRSIGSRPVVVLKIIHNNSDAGKIIFPLKPELTSISKTLEMFVNDFISISTSFPMRYLSSLSLNRLQEIQNTLIILPSQLVPIQPQQYPDRREEIEPSIKAASSTDIKYTNTRCAICGEEQFDTFHGITCKNGHGGADSIIDEPDPVNDFDQFVTENIDKVRIPELEPDTTTDRKEPIIQEFHSPFITGTLKNNILNLEQMIFALTTNNNPLRTIMDSIHNGQGYSLLPGITEQDLKSVAYISNLYYKLNFQSYVQNQTGLPLGIPVVKYRGEGVDRETIELSYDLLMICAYLKLYRSKMEAINSDPYTNGALVHFSFRCFLDVATYSYLNDTNKEAIKNCILSRFKYFREVGFFDHYDKNLIQQNQKPIYNNEITDFVEKVFDNVVDSENIDIRHFNAHDAGSVKIPPKNSFTLEQITNDIVKYEIKTLFGQRIEDLTSDQDIVLLFNTKLKKKIKPTDHRPEPRTYGTHVTRFVKLKANELPEKIREDFVKYVEDISDDDTYDYFNDKFKIEELPEIILQAVYTWDSHSQIKTKYTDYVVDVENCISKDLIISKLKALDDDSEEQESGDWSGAFADIDI